MNKDRVQRKEITGATARNQVKSIKLFCEMNDILLPGKRMKKGLPKARRYAEDRAPTIEEIRRIAEYPDRRIKAIVYTMCSSGIRLGAWDSLKWKHVVPIERNGKVVAAKLIVYPGDPEQYFTFISPEAFFELEKWMNYRRESGEEITGESWILRNVWDNRLGSKRGIISEPRKLKAIAVKRIMESALWTQGLRKKLEKDKKRHEFQADHGYRKWFKTRCELAGIKSINIETLMGHSIGISDSYYRVTEQEILTDYLKGVDYLTISNEHNLKNEIGLIMEQSKTNYYNLRSELEGIGISNAFCNQIVNATLRFNLLSDKKEISMAFAGPCISSIISSFSFSLWLIIFESHILSLAESLSWDLALVD
jgi:integrase